MKRIIPANICGALAPEVRGSENLENADNLTLQL
jgi:hypothetical protein